MKKKRFLSLFTAFCLFASTWLGAFPAYAIAPPEEQSPANEVYQNGPDTTPPVETVPEEPQPAEPGPEESQPEEQPPEIVPALFEVQPRAGEHVHPVCGASCSGHKDIETDHEAVEWTPFPADGTAPTAAGNYYLTEDVTLSAAWKPVAETALCLNGHTLTYTGMSSAISMADNGTFTLCDCGTGGKVTTNTSAVGSSDGAIFYMYGGTLSAGVEDPQTCGVYCLSEGTPEKFNMYGGTIEKFGMGVQLVRGATFNMYDGTIRDCFGETKLSEVTGKRAGVHLGNGSVNIFNMYGGQIIDGKGDGVYVEGASTNNEMATFNMYGGEIRGNAGAGVTVDIINENVEKNAVMNVYGGTITGNKGSGIKIEKDKESINIYGKNDINITGNTLNDKACNVYKKNIGSLISYDTIVLTDEARTSGANIKIGFTYDKNSPNGSLSTITFPVSISNDIQDFGYEGWFESDEPDKYKLEKVQIVNTNKTKLQLVEAAHKHDGDKQFSTDSLPNTPGKYYLAEDGSMGYQSKATWTVPTGGETILCLNGHTLQNNSRDNTAPVISVPDGATLTLCDCSAGETGKIQSNMSKKPNFLVKVEKGGKFNLNSGKIEGTSSQCNVGVYGTFCMTGGKIIGDKDDTTNETGVYVGNDGKFEMTNGNIMDAHTGVDTVKGSTIELTGGEISGNSNRGVNIGAGTTATLAGIHIINNSFKYPPDNRVYHGAGVHLEPDTGDKKTSLTIGAGTVIKDNMVKNEYGTGNPCNLYYSKSCTVINLAEELTSDTEIRIYYGDPEYGAMGDLNRVDPIARNAKKEHLRYIFSDVPGAYTVFHNVDKLYLKRGPELPIVILQPKRPTGSESPVGKELTIDAVTGTGEVTYQWAYRPSSENTYIDVPEANGGKTKTCKIPDLDPGEYVFRCKVSNSNGGEVYSYNVEITIPGKKGSPEITNDPQEPAVNPGESPVGKEISITATGDEPLSYQWKYNTTEEGYENGQDVTLDGTDASCKIPELAAGEYWFWCEVKSGDSEPVRSNKVKITIPEAETPGGKPTIGTQPTAPDIPDGESPVGKDLSVEASSPEEKELHYQWYYNKQNNTTDGTPTGGDSPSCKIPDLPAGTYYFYCVIKDSDGRSTTTNTVKVVIPPKNTGDKLDPGGTITTNDGKTEVSRTGDGGTVAIDKDKTDGKNTDTTITLPEDNKKGEVTVNKDTGEVTVPGGSTVKDGDGTGGGSGGSGKPDVTIGEQGGTVTKDGEVKVPGGGTANVGGETDGNGNTTGGTTITGGEGGTTITPKDDGTADVGDGGKVKTDPETPGKGGTEITLPNGGNVNPGDGSITPDKDESGKQIAGVDTDGDGKVDTLIVLPGTEGGDADGDKIKPNGNGDGGVTVPNGTELSGGENGASVTLPRGGEVTPGGGATPGGGVKPNGSVTTGEDGKTEVTLPENGEIKGDGEGGLKVPGGTTIKNGETGSEIKIGGENGGNGGTLNPEGGVDLPKGGTATIEGGENGKKTEITAGDQGSTVTPKEDGGADVSGGTTVKTGENGAEITVGDNNGKGGTVNKEGEITLPGGGSATIGSGGGSDGKDGQTTITMPDGGGTVKPDESGNVEVPDGSKVKTETTGGEGGGGKDNTEVTLPNGGSVASGDGSITPDKDENGKQIAGVDTDGDGKVDTLIVLPGTGGGSTDGDKIRPNENGGVDVPRGTELTGGNTTGGGENGGSKVVVGEKGGSVNSEGGLDLPKDGTATIEGGKNGEKTEITAGENGGTVKPNGDGSTDVSGSGTKVQAGGSGGGDNKKPAITVDDKGGTVKPDGSLDIKDGASVSIDGEDGSKTTITAPDGSGKTTVTPKDDGTADVTPGTTVQTTPGGGSGQDKQGPSITVGEKGGNVSGEGQVTLPGEGTATVDNGQGGPKTEITADKGGGTVKPNDKGGLDVSGGTTVKTGEDGTKITVGDKDGKGGSLGKDGQVSAPKLEISGEGTGNSNPTIITAPDGGSVTADKDGSAQVPVDSTVSKESVDGKVTIVTVEKVNKVDANGDTVLDENGTVETDKDGTLTFPGGGVVTVKKGDKTAEIEIPAGGSICADSTGTSDVSGTVYVGAGENAPTAPGVTITLQQGNIKYMKTRSDGNGGFLLLNVRKGFYNIVAEQGEKTVTRLFNSDGNEKTDYKLNLPSDNVSSVLDIDSSDAPAPEEKSSVKVEQAVVGGLNIEAELVKQAENADAVKVTMKVAAKAADKAANAAAIQGVARGKKLEYLEVTVVKQVTRGGSSSENAMDQTRTVFEIVIPFTDLRSKSNVTVYRHHNGSANVLNEITGWLEEPGDGDDGKFWADKETDTVHIYTNKFSTYAIGYDDENGGETPVDPKPEPEQPRPSGGSSGGGSSGSSNVSVTGGVTGGRVTVSPTRPMAGQKVTVNVNPDHGYKLDKLTVTDQKGNSVELTMVSDNQYTFVMPAGKVTITPVFVRSEADGQDEKGRTFSDVLESAWYAQYVAYVTAHDLMQGYTDGRFGPNDSTTRGQIVTILYRAEGEPAVERMSGFTDVADAQYYARAVAWAEAGSIVKGYSSTQFGPEDKITREQLAAILYRYAKYKGYAVEASADLSAYADYTRISAYARDAMQWAVADGIMKGKDNSLLDPTGDATRAEVAAMLMRFLDR